MQFSGPGTNCAVHEVQKREKAQEAVWLRRLVLEEELSQIWKGGGYPGRASEHKQRLSGRNCPLRANAIISRETECFVQI